MIANYLDLQERTQKPLVAAAPFSLTGDAKCSTSTQRKEKSVLQREVMLTARLEIFKENL